MVLGMEGVYHIHALLVLQCVKLTTKLLYIHDHFEDQVKNSCTYSRKRGWLEKANMGETRTQTSRHTEVCRVAQEADAPHCEYINRKKENAIFTPM